MEDTGIDKFQPPCSNNPTNGGKHATRNSVSTNGHNDNQSEKEASYPDEPINTSDASPTADDNAVGSEDDKVVDFTDSDGDVTNMTATDEANTYNATEAWRSEPSPSYT